MTTTNVFAANPNAFSGDEPFGKRAVRGWEEKTCRAVYRACAKVIGKDQSKRLVTEMSSPFSGTESYMRYHCLTAGQVWCVAMLYAVDADTALSIVKAA